MINLTKIIDYLLVYLLIAFSGIPFFYKANIVMMISFLAIPLIVFMVRKRKVDRFFIYYVMVALFIQIGQMVKLYHLPILTFLGLHVRLLFAYLCIKAVGKKTIEYYSDILVFSVISSLIFYLPSYIGSFENLLKNSIAPFFTNPFIKEGNYVVWPNIILYTINTKGEGLLWLKRNSGPFWEPGAFSGFLIVALLFHIIQTGTLVNKKNSMLMLGILSTFSSSGLLVMMLVVVFYLSLNKDIVKRFVIIPILILGGVTLFYKVDILGAKVIRKMSYTSKTYNTRFKSAWIDYQDFKQHPLLGLGRSETTRFKGETEGRVIHRNNGVTNHLAMYGGIAFLIYFFLIYLAFYRMCIAHEVDKRMALFSLVTIFLIGFSQTYFTKVFFLALTMIPVLYSGYQVEKESSKEGEDFKP